jgi:Gpi18-like mannosyltransferase/predicted membrane-bound dolichyl-phosphate-mannose-protein mannosyltransferase
LIPDELIRDEVIPDEVIRDEVIRDEHDRRAQLLVGAVIAAGVVARLLVARSPGFPSDVDTFMAWAERLAAIGPGRFYEPGYFSDYPPGFLYVLWLLGGIFDGDLLRTAVKTISIPADIAIAVLVARLVWRHAGRAAAVLAAGLWSLQPAPIFAGPFWGQVDAVGTVPFLAALLATGARRWVLAGTLAAIATMIKPQFAIALGVVLVAAAVAYVRDRQWQPGLRAAGAVTATGVLLALPFGLGLGAFVALIRSASETYPYTSLYAFNIWAIVGDFWKPDDAYVVIGGVLLAIGLLASVIPLWWRRDTAALLAVGAAAAMAFYFLPTRAHERYLFPALALLLPFAVLRRRITVPYAVLAGGFFVTLYFAFTRYPQNDLAAPAWLEATAFSRLGQNAIAVVMLGAAALLCWRLARGEAQLVATATLAPAGSPFPLAGEAAAPTRRWSPWSRWSLPAALGPGRPAGRRDLLIALAVALTVLVTRGYRLDQPRDMYFDEVYHARTALELLAEREPYEWTHPHLAKEIMALGILAFGGDRVAGNESGAPSDLTAFAVGNDGIRVYGRADGSILTAPRGGTPALLARASLPARALTSDGRTIFGANDEEAFTIPIDDVGAARHLKLPSAGPLSAFALVGGRVVVGTATGSAVFASFDGSAPAIPSLPPSVAIAAKPDGSEIYLVDPGGTVHVINMTTGVEAKSYPSVAVERAVAYAQGPHALVLARANEPVLDLIDIEDGHRDQAPLGNARTGSFADGATALATVPRTDFVYAVADGRVVVIDPHGLSPFASIRVADRRLLGVDGTGDAIVVAGGSLSPALIDTGRHALAWRLPGVVASALLAFFLVLLGRRLFASRILPVLIGIAVIIDGSMFAQARIGMNDSYVALFIVAGWYFIVAAHRPRLSRTADLLIAGALLGLGAASKWAAFYTLAGVLVAALAVTAHAYVRGRPGSGGPLDLLAGRGRNAARLFVSFAIVPVAIYWASYLHWFGGPTTPYSWDLVELTKQMYWYHSGLTSPHPAASPWWSWPLVLKPVYWYYGQSEGTSNAYIYDAGNIVLFWGALAATAWCSVAAIRARSATLGFAVFALLVQYVAWIPIGRVLFFYHFYTALPFYLLALCIGLVMLWETGRSRLVVGYLGLAAAAFVFFYPFVSGQPVPAQQAAMFFVLPTWQYDCQFTPSFVCPMSGPSDIPILAIAGRLGVATLAGAVAAGVFVVARSPRKALAAAQDRLGRARGRTRHQSDGAG